ncbi:T9SS type A sorting domain-containing protein [Chryseobacterium sp. 2R14A]|uniref:T9SS type A sorting domain-containing protein n=1 Tax=Chryseobacterium sp. 2R14A TaxID=3380353 RepID=UPI003CF62A78
MGTKLSFILSLSLIFFHTILKGQSAILAVNSQSKTILHLSATDGSVINANFINLSTLTTNPIIGITQVQDKIWITNQGAFGEIYIYNLDGTYSSTIPSSTGLSNIRGLNVVNNEVWVTVGGGNGLPANTIKRFDFAGNPLGNHPTLLLPFDVRDSGAGSAFIGSFFNEGIQIMSYNGVITGNLVGSGVLNGIQQISKIQNGNLLVAVTSNSVNSGNNAGIYIISPINGAIITKWNALIASGVIQSDNGNYIYTSGSTIRSLDTVTGTSSTIISGGNYQYLTRVNGFLGVKESETFKASIYPNPTKGKIHIKSEEAFSSAKIYSKTGQILKTFDQLKGKNNTVDISEMVTGNYILTLQDIKGEVKSFKVIKD